MRTRKHDRTVPIPAPDPGPDQQPATLTFFLSLAEREAVLAALRTRHRSRRVALLRALRLATPAPAHTPEGRHAP